MDALNPEAGTGDIIAQLVAALAELNKPVIPIDIALWDIKMIALYLSRSEAVVREHIVCLRDFPKAIRPPSARTKKGHPLYEATEVIDWARKYKDRN